MTLSLEDAFVLQNNVTQKVTLSETRRLVFGSEVGLHVKQMHMTGAFSEEAGRVTEWRSTTLAVDAFHESCERNQHVGNVKSPELCRPALMKSLRSEQQE